MQLDMSFVDVPRLRQTRKRRQPVEVDEICGIDWIRAKLRPNCAQPPDETCSLIDLFCGCGGLTLGVSEALRRHHKRLDIRLCIDSSEQALGVYKKNFLLPHDRALHDDIRKILPGELGQPPCDDEKRLRDKYVDTDIVVAGPPCQGHSNLNNVTRRNDARNSLYLRVVRLAEIVRPKVVLIENVPAVLRDHGGVVETSRAALEGLGYHTQSLVFNTASLRLPQQRKRHLLIATRKKFIDFKSLLSPSEVVPATLGQYIRDIEDEDESRRGIFYTPSAMRAENRERVNYMTQNGLVDLPNPLRPKCHSEKEHSYVSMYGRLSWDKPAQTITGGFGSMGQGRFVHPSKPRVLTPHEAARLQGFPDFFDFEGVKNRLALHEMIGNAVPPKVSATVLDALLRTGAL